MKALSERQAEVLTWIGDGCPEQDWPDNAHPVGCSSHRVAADFARILGPEHPETAAFANALREWRRRPRWRPRASRRKQ
jgi:hypothetical protein